MKRMSNKDVNNDNKELEKFDTNVDSTVYSKEIKNHINPAPPDKKVILMPPRNSKSGTITLIKGDEKYYAKKSDYFNIPKVHISFFLFRDNTCQLDSVILPRGIKVLTERLFANARLFRLEIPDTLERIEKRCFSGAIFNITSLVIPDSVTYIGSDAFRGSKGCEIRFGTGLRRLKKNTFRESSYAIIDCPNVYVVGKQCFSCINELQRFRCAINLPKANVIKGYAFEYSKIFIYSFDSIKYIGRSCFLKCNFMNDISRCINLRNLRIATFMCSNLDSVIIPNGVEVIGDCCFAYCLRLKEVTIPNSVKRIGNYCFFKCLCLKRIEIPVSVKEVGDFCFFYCRNLESLTWNGKEVEFILARHNAIVHSVIDNSERKTYTSYLEILYKGKSSGIEPGFLSYRNSFNYTNLYPEKLCDELVADFNMDFLHDDSYYMMFDGHLEYYTKLAAESYDQSFIPHMESPLGSTNLLSTWDDVIPTEGFVWTSDSDLETKEASKLRTELKINGFKKRLYYNEKEDLELKPKENNQDIAKYMDDIFELDGRFPFPKPEDEDEEDYVEDDIDDYYEEAVYESSGKFPFKE